MGQSHSDYVLNALMAGSRQVLFDEVWAINSMGGVIDCDRIFMMDGASYLINGTKGLRDDCSGYAGFIRSTKVPIYTAFPEPDVSPTAVAYPLEFVLKDIKYPYMNTTVAYALALAIAEGITEISLYGCDFTYADNHAAESGRGCVEFLIGIAVSRGIKINVAGSSTLLDSNCQDKFYAYDGRVKLVSSEDGTIKVEFMEAPNATHSS
jgi:hypothetical protein